MSEWQDGYRAGLETAARMVDAAKDALTKSALAKPPGFGRLEMLLEADLVQSISTAIRALPIPDPPARDS